MSGTRLHWNLECGKARRNQRISRRASSVRALAEPLKTGYKATARPAPGPADPFTLAGGGTSTLVVRAKTAKGLLPVTNELFFHVLADLGHGVQLSEPLTRYRVHEASMTDRRTPGVFADYQAGICADAAIRLDQLREPPLLSACRDKLDYLATAYRERSPNSTRKPSANAIRQDRTARRGDDPGEHRDVLRFLLPPGAGRVWLHAVRSATVRFCPGRTGLRFAQRARYDAGTLLDLHARCLHAGPAWQRAVEEFAEYVIALISLCPC